MPTSRRDVERRARCRGGSARSRTIATPCSSSSRQRDGAELELHPPGLDLREVEDLVDELEQVAPGVADVADVLLLALVELAEHPVEQHVGEADHGVQRRAQLVRHAGQELGLVPARRPRARRVLSSSSRNTRALWIATADWLASVSSSVDGRSGERARRPAADDERADDLLLAPQRHARPSSASRGGAARRCAGRAARRRGRAPAAASPRVAARPMNVSPRRMRDVAAGPRRARRSCRRRCAARTRRSPASNSKIEPPSASGELDGAGHDRRRAPRRGRGWS